MPDTILKKENTKAWKCVFLFFLLSRNILQCYYAYNNDVIDMLFSIMSAASAFVITFYYFVVKRSSFDKMFMGVLFFILPLFYSTFINSGSIWSYMVTIYPIIGMYCLAHIAFKCEYRKKRFLSILASCMLWLICINVAFLLIDSTHFGAGEYFLGKENQISFSLLLGLLVCWLNKEYNNSSIKFALYIVLYVICSFKIWSASGIIGCFIILGYCFIPLFKIIFYRISFRSIQFFVVLLLVLLCIHSFRYDVLSHSNFFVRFIEDYLGKDMSFTGRTYIWKTLFESLHNKAIFGYGIHEITNIFHISVVTSQNQWINGIFSAHNTFYQVLFNGGILSLVALLNCGTRIQHVNNENYKVLGIYKVIVLTLSVMMMAEAVSAGVLFVVYFWAYADIENSSMLIKQEVQNDT